MSKPNELDILARAYRKALKAANEAAARTNTLLVSCEGDKIKMIEPNVKYIGFEPIDFSKKKKALSKK